MELIYPPGTLLPAFLFIVAELPIEGLLQKYRCEPTEAYFSPELEDLLAEC